MYKLILFWLCIISCTSNTKKQDDFEKIFHKYDEGTNPGFTAFVLKNGKRVYQKSFGYANLEKKIRINENTIFDIGSITKGVTAYSVLILSDQNIIKLEDPIRKYLPKLPLFFNKITIKNLIFHTSGLTRDFPKKECDKLKKYKNSPNQFLIDWLVKTDKKKYLKENEIGLIHTYSNIGYRLLGALIEKASGQTYKRFIEKEIFNKIGIDDGYVQGRELVSKINTIGYDTWPKFNKGKMKHCLSMVGSRGVYFSITDLTKWVMELQSKSLLSKESKKLLFQKGINSKGEKISYGYGFQFYESPKYQIIFHTGSWDNFTSMISYTPKKNI